MGQILTCCGSCRNKKSLFDIPTTSKTRYQQQRSHITRFGMWRNVDVPYTVNFDNARKVEGEKYPTYPENGTSGSVPAQAAGPWLSRIKVPRVAPVNASPARSSNKRTTSDSSTESNTSGNVPAQAGPRCSRKVPQVAPVAASPVDIFRRPYFRQKVPKVVATAASPASILPQDEETCEPTKDATNTIDEQ